MIYGNKLDKIALCEESIYKGNGVSISIDVDKNRNYGDKPYVKIYNDENYRKATKIARISVSEKPEYIVHKDSKQPWNLNAKEKQKINDIFSTKKPNVGNYSNCDSILDAIKSGYSKTNAKINIDKFKL